MKKVKPLYIILLVVGLVLIIAGGVVIAIGGK
jgi:hypothetical protein